LRSLSAGSSGSRPRPTDPCRPGRATRPSRETAICSTSLPFGLTLNGVKKHVGVLADADLVITEKVGRARECRLGPAQLHDASRWIEDYRRAWGARLDRFESYVEQRTGGGR
jgi:hypothetical protein